jgi:hypothetical protein
MTRFRHRALALALLALIALLPWAGPGQAAVSGRAAVLLDLKDIRTSGAEQGTVSISQSFNWDITNGTGAGQANLCYQGVRTLTTGANEDLDVSGSLTNLFGTAVFTKVKLIAISAAAANTTALTVIRPASNGVPFFAAAGDGFTLEAGDFFALTRRSAAGIAVTAGTGDLINVANAAGASATYTVIVCGLS